MDLSIVILSSILLKTLMLIDTDAMQSAEAIMFYTEEFLEKEMCEINSVFPLAFSILERIIYKELVSTLRL